MKFPKSQSPITVSVQHAFPEESESVTSLLKDADSVLQRLLTGEFKRYTGWLNFPDTITAYDLEEIQAIADALRTRYETIVCIGVGGSFLGAQALISALNPYFRLSDEIAPELIFAGHHLSEEFLSSLLNYLRRKDFGLVVISKSGSTLEPAIAYRLLEGLLLERFGAEGVRERTVIITDPQKGPLRDWAKLQKLQSFSIPPEVGGRFSVLTPVGLLPCAIAGINIRELLEGARVAERSFLSFNASENPALIYASARQALYKQGKKIELFATFEPKFFHFGEWWKQLFAESEGKSGKGLFAATATFTTDLHSLGQWIQDGERSLFETLLLFPQEESQLRLSVTNNNSDRLNFLAGENFSYLRKCAIEGTIEAHKEGNVPILTITSTGREAFHLGALVYFFELVVAVSGLLMQINPFDQPGVESYKSHMYRLLHKRNDQTC